MSALVSKLLILDTRICAQELLRYGHLRWQILFSVITDVIINITQQDGNCKSETSTIPILCTSLFATLQK